MAPPASTWYRLRNPTSPNQPPLCSRAYPPGVPSADEKTGEQRARGDGLVMCGRQHCLHGRSWGPPYHWSSFHLVSTRIPAVGRRQRRASFSRLSLPYFGRRPQTPDISSLDRPKIRGRIFPRLAESGAIERQIIVSRPPSSDMRLLKRSDGISWIQRTRRFHFLSADSLGTRFWRVCLQASLVVGSRLHLWDGAETLQPVPHSSVGITPLFQSPRPLGATPRLRKLVHFRVR